MNTITSYANNNPSFGMAVKFNNSGKKFFNKVFAENPSAGHQYIMRQANNKSADIFVNNSNIYVGLNAKKWRVVGSIRTNKQNGQSVEELSCTRSGNIFRKQAVKTIIMEDIDNLAKRYGENAKRFAVAEEIANYQKYVSGNKRPSLLEHLLGLFKNS